MELPDSARTRGQADDLELFPSEQEPLREPGPAAAGRADAVSDPPARVTRTLSMAVAIALIGGAIGAFAAGAYLYTNGALWPGAETSVRSRTDTREPAMMAEGTGGTATGVTARGERDQTNHAVSRDAAQNGNAPGSPPAPNGRATDTAAQPARTAEPPAAGSAAANAEATARSAAVGDDRTISVPAPSTEPAPALSDAQADVSGTWMLATHVESSALGSFEGLRLGYELHLEQDGRRVTGTGYKVTENGSTIRAAGRTPIRVQGTSDDDRLTLSFVERGTRRASSGTFVLFREGEDRLRGRFASDAARSSGTVEAQRR